MQNIYKFNIGEWQCISINDGLKFSTLDRLFDKVNIQKILPVVEKYNIDTNKITMSYNILVLKNHDHTIIIDTGMGKDPEVNSGKLLENLRIADIDPNEIDCIIISHCHLDHIGGITDENGFLNFPKAKFYISKKEWKFWTSENNLENMPKKISDIVRKNLPPIKHQLVLLEGNEEIFEGIKSIPAAGHTPGNIVLLISSGTDKMLYAGDIVHFEFQFEVPDASSKFDMNSMEAAMMRKTIIELAKKNKYKLFGFHLEFPGIMDLKNL
jgi:glyoxylase-like metal-dependent hydrolase (beta-lactamase superfamily II)